MVDGLLKIQQFAALDPEAARQGIPVVAKPYIAPGPRGREQLIMPKFFINRPIVAMCIAILMVLVGVVAMLSLPTAQFPNIADPQIQVLALYPGADSQTIAESVATPIEQQMSGVSGMNYMYSTSASNGSMTLTVDFALGHQRQHRPDSGADARNQANSQLPSAVLNSGITVQQSTPSPLMLLALSSPNGTYDNIFLANYANINLNYALTRLPGVASVSVFGAGQYAMRVWVNPDTLANSALRFRKLSAPCRRRTR